MDRLGSDKSGHGYTVPSWSLPARPDSSNYRRCMWIKPRVLILGALAALALRERPADAPL